MEFPLGRRNDSRNVQTLIPLGHACYQAGICAVPPKIGAGQSRCDGHYLSQRFLLGGVVAPRVASRSFPDADPMRFSRPVRGGGARRHRRLRRRNSISAYFRGAYCIGGAVKASPEASRRIAAQDSPASRCFDGKLRAPMRIVRVRGFLPVGWASPILRARAGLLEAGIPRSGGRYGS